MILWLAKPVLNAAQGRDKRRSFGGVSSAVVVDPARHREKAQERDRQGVEDRAHELRVIAFLDASALFYLVEGAEPFASRVRNELAQAFRKHPAMGAAMSRLSWLECRVRPARDNDLATLAAFDAFLNRPELVWIEPGRDVVERAAAIRVKHGLRTPEAHLPYRGCGISGSRRIEYQGAGGARRQVDA